MPLAPRHAPRTVPLLRQLHRRGGERSPGASAHAARHASLAWQGSQALVAWWPRARLACHLCFGCTHSPTCGHTPAGPAQMAGPLQDTLLGGRRANLACNTDVCGFADGKAPPHKQKVSQCGVCTQVVWATGRHGAGRTCTRDSRRLCCCSVCPQASRRLSYAMALCGIFMVVRTVPGAAGERGVGKRRC